MEVTSREGKPCMLKCHVNRDSASIAKTLEADISGPLSCSNVCAMGRQLDPISNGGAR